MALKKKHTLKLFLLAFILFGSEVFASFLGPHRLALGPEIFFMQRNKEGGSKQHGMLYGARLTYDRLKGNSLYWGGDLMYASGKLNGHNSESEELHSQKRDSEIEGRFGYTFKRKFNSTYWFIPFFGGGYFEGTNKFKHPSPLTYKITTSFPYLSLGFISRIDIKNSFGIGLDFKTKYSVGAKGKITEDLDPEIDNSHFIIEDKFSYELDLPFYFDKCFKGKLVELSFVPFYRFRHYGGHENHPFDFIDTRFHIYGARLMLGLYF